MVIKVCGMKHAGNIRALDKLEPDMTGFIFHSSSPRFADAVPEYMPASSLRVGVFVNSDTDYILYKVREFGLKTLCSYTETNRPSNAEPYEAKA